VKRNEEEGQEEKQMLDIIRKRGDQLSKGNLDAAE
jgi:hypothetical protein